MFTLVKPTLAVVLGLAGSLLVFNAASLKTTQAEPSFERVQAGAEENVVQESKSAQEIEKALAYSPRMSAESSPLELLDAYLNEAVMVIDERAVYTATLEKQVDVQGTLQDVEAIQIKIRHEPFSAYLKWERDHQQVLYVEGENDNRLIARPTNGLSLLRSIWKLDPKSPQAMRGDRYPVTEIGIGKLTERLHKFYSDRDGETGMTCAMREEELSGRPVVIFDVVFHSPSECEDYSHSTIYFDAIGKWVVGVENKGWSTDGREGELLERYLYHDVDFDAKLTSTDFSIDNPEYKFAKKN